ncbi:MAG: hypothetical protein PSX81_12400 [bacterium]|nr:hypothetical protein [bacterium]
MGYKIETYSLAELNRISTPGKVVPALFWLIPVGQWDSHELERLWYHFTRENSKCNELGLMLVKNTNRWNTDADSSQTSDLSDLTGKLSDLLPSRIKTIYDDEYLSQKDKKNQILILSGSYPQPGWGVLISLKKHDDIERLLEGAIDRQVHSLFSEASNSFKTWTALKTNKPIKGDVNILKNKKRYCFELYKILESLLAELNINHLNNFYYEILKKVTKESSFKEFNEQIDPLFDIANDEFILSLLLVKASMEIAEDELNSSLISFNTQHNSKTNNLFKSEKNDKIKKIASFLLKLNERDRPNEMFALWAENIFNNKINDIIITVKGIKDRFQSLIGEFELTIDRFETSYDSELIEWQQKVEQSRLLFHKQLQEVLKSHLEHGPSFLVKLEKQTQRKGISSKSISWDPPRMVGWKLLTEGIQIANFDITTYLREMTPEFTNQVNNESINHDTLVNGSLFTDYVHYISKSDINLSSRNATKRLLEKLLRSGEIKSILKNYQPGEILDQTHGQIVEKLLVEFGWPAEKFGIKNKLADCIVENEGSIIINKSLTGNDIRIICESYCKDLVDTLCSIIGYTANELLDLVISRYPDYRSHNRGWNHDISNLTLGSAHFILSALLNEAFPDKKEASINFIQSLEGLRKKFNDLSHDPPIGETSNLVEGILALIKYTNELIFEMPWHFYPVQRNGHQPTVLTGDAWSHSHKQNRQLSIILWHNDSNSESMLVWNPSKVNPVIPDGIIINRP